MAEFSYADQAENNRLASSPASGNIGKDGKQIVRLKSQELMHQMREVEIDHEGRIYRLRVTQLNKLILTA
ncbi:hemin uptake protein HemP [Undibacterium sp. RTI2.1]|uniref:hemin uptake protein HemP n=1 Tax=unclassified Undibacterium TaxID=2630295 RepID=UPI002AB49816|nr:MULTISPECIES: hemin uptake protein HemP [unclassified Undibacterium]MDY7538830.1 hemin uptake protein HemP [Undibacterium sp. 5I1]MEB0031978.1 hemin uptake protein HemP [Undibacterium sp. RTI2.1]MEB0118187.1 hemin uptake protein HemP [Undibacterium sp. RTI2.2]MEB0231827.1 hemin uptake protein HemP [Undibacterium sp. 10I3]MEB0258913.1 hemin uptake protein HemP [Undibacterium sp. 5I1]